MHPDSVLELTINEVVGGSSDVTGRPPLTSMASTGPTTPGRQTKMVLLWLKQTMPEGLCDENDRIEFGATPPPLAPLCFAIHSGRSARLGRSGWNRVQQPPPPPPLALALALALAGPPASTIGCRPLLLLRGSSSSSCCTCGVAIDVFALVKEGVAAAVAVLRRLLAAAAAAAVVAVVAEPCAPGAAAAAAAMVSLPSAVLFECTSSSSTMVDES